MVVERRKSVTIKVAPDPAPPLAGAGLLIRVGS
jgi:hypothetical protein